MAKKASTKIKEPVRLRRKKLSNGNFSLYLDIYRDGHRGKSSVSCPLKPSDSTPLKHSTMPP